MKAKVPPEMVKGVEHAGKKLMPGDEFDISDSDRVVAEYERFGFIVIRPKAKKKED